MPKEKLTGTAEEFHKLSIEERLASLMARMEMAEHNSVYSISNKDNTDWFMFENRIRKVITELVQPTIRRMEELRDKIKDQSQHSHKMQEQCEEMYIEVKDLSSLKTESFK